MSFVRRTFRRYPELFPLLFFISLAVTGSFASMFRGLVTKPDVWVNKKNKIPPWERIEGDQNTKLMNINQQYRTIPELEELKKDLRS